MIFILLKWPIKNLLEPLEAITFKLMILGYSNRVVYDMYTIYRIYQRRDFVIIYAFINR